MIRILLGIVPSAEHLGQSFSRDFAHDLSEASRGARWTRHDARCIGRVAAPILPRGDQVVSLGSVR